MVVQLILPVLLIFHFVFSREHCPDLKRGDFTEYFEVYGKDLGDRRYEIHGFFTELDKPLKNGYKITVSEGDPINPGHFDFSILLSGLADKKNDVVILDPLRKLDGENLFEFPPNSVNFIRQNYAFTFGDLLILNQTHFADIPEIDENRLDGKALYRFEPLANLRKFNYSEDAIEGIRKCFDRKKLEYCTFNGTHVIEGERQFLGINEGWAISMAPYERRFTLYQINNTENCFNIPWTIENAIDHPISLIPLLKLPFINSDSPLIERFRPKPVEKVVLKAIPPTLSVVNVTEIHEVVENTTTRIISTTEKVLSSAENREILVILLILTMIFVGF